MHFDLPDPQQVQEEKVFDPALLPLQKPEMIYLGQRMMDMIKAYNPEILAGAGVNKDVYHFEYANSKGASYSTEHTDFYIAAVGQFVREIIAGNGGSAAEAGFGGNITNVHINGDLGDFASAFDTDAITDSGMGGLVAGQGGIDTDTAEIDDFLNGEISKVTAQRIVRYLHRWAGPYPCPR